MDDKTKLELYKELEKQREQSDKTYAPIIVKVIVFGMVAIILSTALAKLLTMLWK